jgi:hypothetical protein
MPAPRILSQFSVVAVSVTPRTTSRRLKGGESGKTNKQHACLSLKRKAFRCVSRRHLVCHCAVECTNSPSSSSLPIARCLTTKSPFSKRLSARVLLLVGTSPLVFSGLLCLRSPLHFSRSGFSTPGTWRRRATERQLGALSPGSSPRRSNRWAQLRLDNGCGAAAGHALAGFFSL